MNKVYFFFYSALLLLCVIFAGLGDVNLEVQLAISLIFIVLIGIPHGAIDHLLVKQEGIKKPIKFYAFYIGLLLLNIVVWITIPVLGLISFLGISAYHFGQSQFASINSIHPYLKRLLYLFWGVSILSGLIYFNFDEVQLILQQSADLSNMIFLPDSIYLKNILVYSSIGSIAILIYCRIAKSISSEQLITELLFFGLIHVCFFLLPILIGFTLYFIVLHSLKVLIEEFEYLKKIKSNIGLKTFILQLLPYTFLSLLGGVVLLVLNVQGYLYMSGAFLLLVLISSITLPHSIVMEGFYHHHSNSR
ncbi:MAG: beta-carotene 15,15'-dioxygenase, Brp/Blh family [Saprospiraceae bacterium]|nr:beta-carotene 15,15'-dioxygenase, Brp/Blh family [Saprospiraceae bacterium]